MNKLFRAANGNKRAAAVIILSVALIVGLWYFLHPSSSYHKKVTYVLRFTEIGTLSPGNRVQVNGLSKGKIVALNITDDYIFVTIQVLSSVQIPNNSVFRLVTAGFLGEKEVFISLGTSPKFFAPGDTIQGIYDAGMAGINKNIIASLAILKELSENNQKLSDSLLKGETGKSLDRIQSNGARLAATAKAKSSEWSSETLNLLDNLNGTADKLSALIQASQGNLELTLSEADSFLSQIETLKVSVLAMKTKMAEISQKMDGKDNTVGLILAEQSTLFEKIEKLTQDVERLTAKIKKSGIRFNVDVF